ncbi:MAG: hypothetical protein KC619_29300 [Myxococcales bacterium]|nr:hypothetical protein [Myxococcales bacterium]
MSAEPPIPRVKGSALAYWLTWYAQHRDPAELGAIAARIPPEERGEIDPTSPTLGVISTAWYPAHAVGRILDGVTEGMSAKERAQLIEESTAAGVEQGIRGIFKLAFELLATPERYAKHIQRFWDQLHDTGTRRVEIVGPGEAISIIEDWPGHHPLLCTVTMETMAAVFRRMGLEDVEVMRVECVGAHDPRCKAIVRWRP